MMRRQLLALSIFCLTFIVQKIEAQNCFSSSSPSFCLSFFKLPSCSCTGACDVSQQISQDINTLRSIISKIEQRDPSSCLYYNNTGLTYPSSCCSFPFTLNGGLYFNCVPGQTVEPGCFLEGRSWVRCSDPGFTAYVLTVYIPIPLFPGLTPLRSVNGWIVFQQRINSDENFDRPWADYRDGFGNQLSNFWMGLEKLYQLCNKGNCKLRMEVLSTTNEWVSQEYQTFFVAPEYEEYAIHFVGSSGDGEDYFSSRTNPNGVINGMRFTTKDRDHDTRPTENCAVLWEGGWWYNNCCWYNFNGRYGARGFSGGNGMMKLTTSRMMLKVASL